MRQSSCQSFHSHGLHGLSGLRLSQLQSNRLKALEELYQADVNSLNVRYETDCKLLEFRYNIMYRQASKATGPYLSDDEEEEDESEPGDDN